MGKIQNKAKTNIIFIVASAIVILFLTINATGFPTNEANCTNTGCHTNEASQVIITHNLTVFNYSRGESFPVEIEVTNGYLGMYVLFHPEQKDNGLLVFSPEEKIQDNSVDDGNPADAEMNVTYTLTLPDQDVDVEIDFYVIYADTDTHVRYSKVATFVFQVGQGGAANRIVFTGRVDHYSIYLGAPAILFLAIGTILYERNKEKFTKTHGILATTSLILTTVNVIFIIPEAWSLLLFMDWVHIIHIVLGVGGYIAGIIAVITGISGIRVKWPGYTALICWTINFLLGILTWGIVI